MDSSFVQCFFARSKVPRGPWHSPGQPRGLSGLRRAAPSVAYPHELESHRIEHKLSSLNRILSMSLLRIPFVMSTAVGIHIVMTPPQAPPPLDERIKPTGLENVAPYFPLVVKVRVILF